MMSVLPLQMLRLISSGGNIVKFPFNLSVIDDPSRMSYLFGGYNIVISNSVIFSMFFLTRIILWRIFPH